MKKNFRKLSTNELERIDADEYKNSRKIPVVLVLDNIRSANNVGSMFRTADAFLIEHMYLCGITACPPNKEIHKTALGAEQSVPFTSVETTLQAILQLQSQGYTIVCIEQVAGSTELQQFDLQQHQKYALVFGNEVFGVADEVVAQSDDCIEIPQFGTKHSFNVSVTCGIVLWYFAQSFIAKSRVEI